MKVRLLALALAAAVVSPVAMLCPVPAEAAPAASATTAPDPAAQVVEWAQLFRRSDVGALLRATVPPSRWEEIRIAYEVKRDETPSETEREHFAETIERYTGPGAVDRLMEEFEPRLAEARPRAPAAIALAFAAARMALTSDDTDLTAAQREQLERALPAVQDWALKTDFLSSDTLRLALSMLTDAARQTGIDSIDRLRELPLDALVDRASPLLGAAKDAARLYGLDLDAIAASLQVAVVEIDGSRAKVRTTITAFGAPLSAEHELVLVDGRWYPEDSVRKVHISMH